MTIPTKGGQSPATYTRSSPPSVSDLAALAVYLARELQKLESASRRTDERLKAGGL